MADWDATLLLLRGYRERTGMTQVDVARRMGVSQSRVSDFERGIADPHVSTIVRYMHALDLELSFEVLDAKTGKPVKIFRRKR